jgi:catechol 2,3-dioxygenase-like lactoylglutathione lyase family enzyme
MQQQISVVTLGIAEVACSKRFYTEGFGWQPVFENEEVVFYQMNGLMLGTWLRVSLEADMQQTANPPPGTASYGHNVPSEAEVDAAIERLVAAGGRLLRPADAPPHGGYRGYVADPDEHVWEIAFNPAWPIDADGHVTFGV